MARNISDIKMEMARELMRNEQAAERYGFEPGAEFGDVFGAPVWKTYCYMYGPSVPGLSSSL